MKLKQIRLHVMDPESDPEGQTGQAQLVNSGYIRMFLEDQ